MLQINHLMFGYSSKQALFKDLSLELKSGHIYGLLGKNGAGKTSLLKTMCGLLFPKKGTVQLMEHIPSQRKPDFLQKIFFVPEEVELPGLSVTTFAKVNGTFYPEFGFKKFASLLEELEVPLESQIKELSFGQQKKVFIAFAIATNVRMLIMDEPTNGLDIPSKAQFRKIMAGHINDDRCIIISTHQVRDLDSLIDAVIIVDNGEIILNKTIGSITDKLVFKVLQNEPEHMLYARPSIAGNLAVLENIDKEESKLDMELLFCAATEKKTELLKIFNN